MAKESSNPYGISKKKVSGLSLDLFKRYQRALFRQLKESNATQKKEQERTQQMFSRMMSLMSKQVETIDDATDSTNKNSLPFLLKQGFQGVSSGIHDVNKSLQGLVLTLKRQQIERKVLADKEVREKTRLAQKTMTRERQKLRDKAAPGMLLRGLFASQMAPAWSQWVANKMGIRSFETVREDVREREQVEVDIAKTKIGIARQKKRGELMGVTGEGIAGLAGREESETGKKLKESLDKLATVADMFRQAIQRFGGEQIITEPLLTVAKEKQFKERYEQSMQSMKKMPVGPPPQSFLQPFFEEEKGISVRPLPTPTEGLKEEKTKQARMGILPEAILRDPKKKVIPSRKEDVFPGTSPSRDFMKKIASEGAMPISFTSKTEESLSKTIGKYIKEGIVKAFKEMEKGETYGETGGEEELGLVGPETQIAQGPIEAMAKSLGVGIKETVASIPVLGGIFKGSGGAGHQHGGTVSPAAGTGSSFFKMNPREGINLPYDNMAVDVPSNLGLNIVPETDMQKLANMKKNVPSSKDSNAILASILKELLKTNQKANDLLEQIIEKNETMDEQIPPAPTRVASPGGGSMSSRKGSGYGLSPIKVL